MADRRVGWTAAALALGLGAPAAAADLVILESDVDALGAGFIVPEDTPVEIASGRRMLVIDAGGRTLIVRGPCSGTLLDCAERRGTEGRGEDAVPMRPDPLPRLGAVRDR